MTLCVLGPLEGNGIAMRRFLPGPPRTGTSWNSRKRNPVAIPMIQPAQCTVHVLVVGGVHGEENSIIELAARHGGRRNIPFCNVNTQNCRQ